MRFSGPEWSYIAKTEKIYCCYSHVRTIQTDDFRRRDCSPVSHPYTASTGSADQFEHCPNSGCPCDPTPSRNQAAHLGHFAVGPIPNWAKEIRKSLTSTRSRTGNRLNRQRQTTSGISTPKLAPRSLPARSGLCGSFLKYSIKKVDFCLNNK